MRLAVEARPFGPHPLLGLGVDDLRRLAPVRPVDTLHLEDEVIELKPLEMKPQGIARVKWTAINQHGEPRLHVYADRHRALSPEQIAYTLSCGLHRPTHFSEGCSHV